jgi:hypothetical protein
LSLQSTHNTGVVTAIYTYVVVMNIIEDEAVSLSLGACICCIVAMTTCFTGIGLLAVVDCCSRQKKVTHVKMILFVLGQKSEVIPGQTLLYEQVVTGAVIYKNT